MYYAYMHALLVQTTNFHTEHTTDLLVHDSNDVSLAGLLASQYGYGLLKLLCILFSTTTTYF